MVQILQVFTVDCISLKILRNIQVFEIFSKDVPDSNDVTVCFTYVAQILAYNCQVSKYLCSFLGAEFLCSICSLYCIMINNPL